MSSRGPIGAPALLALATLLCAGCSQEAVFELGVFVTPAPGGGTPTYAFDPAYLVVHARRTPDFAADWGTDFPPGTVLTTTAEMADRVTLVTSSPDIDVYAKIRICRTPDCSAPEDAMLPEGYETWVRFERPFFAGEQSFIDIGLTMGWDATPPEHSTFSRCDIRACTLEPRGSFCDADGRHLCDR